MRGFCIFFRFYICQVSEYSRFVNMPGFWIYSVVHGLPIFVNMSSEKYVLNIRQIQLWKGSEYFRILNIPGLCICKRYTFSICLNMAEQCLNKLFWLCQGSEYVCSKFNRVLNTPPILKLPGLKIWPDCEYEVT